MKLKHAAITASFLLFAFSAAPPARAQIPVTDVGNIVQDAANEVVNLAEYVEMVSNQVQQLNSMTQQLQQVTAYVKAFGDPSQILSLVGADELINSLNESGVGQTYAAVRDLSDGVQALTANGQGLYRQIGSSFELPSGTKLPRAVDLYRKFDAVSRASDNYSAVYDDALDRRKVLKGQIASTTQQLQASSTDAETQKLNGVIAGQAAQLEAIDREVAFAATQAAVQDVENRSDAEKQKQAHLEEQQAEFSEATSKYSTTFQLSAEAPSFNSTK